MREGKEWMVGGREGGEEKGMRREGQRMGRQENGMGRETNERSWERLVWEGKGRTGIKGDGVGREGDENGGWGDKRSAWE